MVTITLYASSRGDADVRSRLLDSVGEGEDGVVWEGGIEECIVLCVGRVTSPGSMHDVGCSGLVFWDDPGGWCWGWVGAGFRVGDTCVPMADSC